VKKISFKAKSVILGIYILIATVIPFTVFVFLLQPWNKKWNYILVIVGIILVASLLEVSVFMIFKSNCHTDKLGKENENRQRVSPRRRN
jgi:phosphotransferase system  glucose/maltose/N-acetylglucosamine-specific IIC component